MNRKLPRSDYFFSYYLPHKELSAYIAYYSVQHQSFTSIAPRFLPDLGGSIIVSHHERDLEIMLWGPHNQLTAIENRRHHVEAR